MRKLWIVLLIAGIAIIAMSVFQYITRPNAGDIAPLFTLTSTDSRSVSLEGFKGRPVLVHFWASWCGQCRIGFPTLNTLQKQFDDGELVVLAISEDDDINMLRSFLNLTKPNFLVLIDQNGAVADAYQSWAVPEYFLINEDGIIVWRKAGAINWNSDKARDTLKKYLEM